VFPLMNSMIPEMNWHTPPKKMKTTIKTFGVATPQTCTPNIEIKKIPRHSASYYKKKGAMSLPVAKDSSPRGAWCAKLRCTTGSDGCALSSGCPSAV
jgi:hypothetical protein